MLPLFQMLSKGPWFIFIVLGSLGSPGASHKINSNRPFRATIQDKHFLRVQPPSGNFRAVLQRQDRNQLGLMGEGQTLTHLSHFVSESLLIPTIPILSIVWFCLPVCFLPLLFGGPLLIWSHQRNSWEKDMLQHVEREGLAFSVFGGEGWRTPWKL